MAEKLMLDLTGFPVPVLIRDDWNRAKEKGERWLKTLDQIIQEVTEGIESGDVIFAELHISTVSEIKMIRQSLERVVPYAVCPTCQGIIRLKCALCRQRGFISEFLFTTVVPVEIREMRERVVREAKCPTSR